MRGLLGRDDVHDDAALEHLGEALLGGPGGCFGHGDQGSPRGRVRGRPSGLPRGPRPFEPVRSGVTRRLSHGGRRCHAGGSRAYASALPADGSATAPACARPPTSASSRGGRSWARGGSSASTRPRTSSSGSPSRRRTSRRIVSSGTSPRRRSARSSSVGSRRETSPTARSKRRTNTRNVASHSRSRTSSASPGCCASAAFVSGERALQHDDDRVALADLALRHDAAEPSPVVADGHVGGAGGTAPSDAAGLRDALDQAPGLGLGEGQAGRAMAQAQGLADLALGEGLPARHQVGVHAGDRGRDAPRGAHLAPGVRQLEADLLGDGRGGARCRVDERARRRRSRLHATPPGETCPRLIADFDGRTHALDPGVSLAHARPPP